jgi:hypothetical protein
MADSNRTKTVVVRRAPKSPAINVVCTKERIEEAKRLDSRHCWIAEAIKEAAPYLTNIIVDTATCRGTDADKGLRYIYLTPQITRNAIYRFDYGHDVEEFSFQLRGAQVKGVKRKDGAKKHITKESWQKVKDRVRKISSEEGIKLRVISDEMGVNGSTLRTVLSSNDVPTTVNVDKIEKWVLKHTGEKPAPRIKSRADQASGPARLRAWNPKQREQPEIIGGAHPRVDINLTLRQFGLRQLNWKIPGTETHIDPPSLRPEE